MIQFFYYHNNVDRSLSIRDDTGNTVTLTEQGTPVIATGSFTADSQRQRLTLDASVGSQFLNAYQFRAIQSAPLYEHQDLDTWKQCLTPDESAPHPPRK